MSWRGVPPGWPGIVAVAAAPVRGRDRPPMQPTGVKEVSARRELAHGSVSERDGVVSVDQDAIRGSRRSNPAT